MNRNNHNSQKKCPRSAWTVDQAANFLHGLYQDPLRGCTSAYIKLPDWDFCSTVSVANVHHSPHSDQSTNEHFRKVQTRPAILISLRGFPRSPDNPTALLASTLLPLKCLCCPWWVSLLSPGHHREPPEQLLALLKPHRATGEVSCNPILNTRENITDTPACFQFKRETGAILNCYSASNLNDYCQDFLLTYTTYLPTKSSSCLRWILTFTSVLVTA